MTQRRRFYKTVSVTDDHAIALDGRPVKTPMKAKLQLPTRGLAEAIAAEWQSQGEKIDPAAMVFTKLANTAIDLIARNRPRVIEEILDYANNDLVCYRAERPAMLVKREAEKWDPVVDWARTAIDAPIEVRSGIVHVPQPSGVAPAIETALANHSDFELAAFYTMMTLTGSTLLPLMQLKGTLSAQAAWDASNVDEDFQNEYWGKDQEAMFRRVLRYTEFDACCRFLALARA